MRSSSSAPAAVSRSADSIASTSDGRNAVAAADHAQANSFSGTGGGFGAKIIFEKCEQRDELRSLGRSQLFEEKAYSVSVPMPSAGSGAHHAAHGFDAGAMAFRTRQAARGSPAAVAVEQDGDVKLGIGILNLSAALLFIESPGKLLYRRASNLPAWRGSALPCGPDISRARGGRRQSGDIRFSACARRTISCRRCSRHPRACARGRSSCRR